MHHQDFSGDPPGTGSRKTAFHYRRGSSGASAAAGSGGSSAVDDNPSQAGSSSPATHHQPQTTGAQVKKKSGFQITSVTSAQVNVSGNNSLADDTESYDDMDESHTEDLSSSDMLDVSVSRATDTGVPERSSSDETLNSLHGVDTPGLVSPNEPLQPHAIPQGVQHSSLVNGTVHHLQQHRQAHQHPSDSLGGVEPSLSTLPMGTSSPGPSQSQRPPMLDNSKPAGVAGQQAAPVIGGAATDVHVQGSVNILSLSTVPAAAVPTPGPAAFDSTTTSGQGASTGGGTGSPASAHSTHTQHTQTQTATGSRFRVVKLDTNSEPFRKGRWTCTEYYEKEVPHPTPSEAQKAADLAAESEAGNAGISSGVPAAQPPHTLQPYQLPSQDFTSPQTMQSPPQALTQTTPLSYGSPQEVVGTSHIQKPVAPIAVPTATPQVGVGQPPPVIPQQLPYAVDPQQAQPQEGYPTPQLQAGGVIAPGRVRQPDFIQPTAPFQTQVQPQLPHVITGMSITPVAGVSAQQPVSITPQLQHQGQVAPPVPSAYTAVQLQALPTQPQPQPQVQRSSTGTVPLASTHGIPYMPLTALQADLQPLLTSGSNIIHVPGGAGGGGSIKTSHLEDAQKLLFQHQGLLGLPRLGAAAGGDGAMEGGRTVGSLAQMGMSAEASAFMVAAAGLRSQHAEGEEDSSSGASVVAIDNKIEQAMDLVKSHLMYAVREEVEVLKEQIKELMERNTQLEQENNLLKTLASPEQLAQFQAQVQTGGSPTGAAQPPAPSGTTQAPPSTQNSGTSA
ncbi:TSC22 domain family protein 1 isoform X1 [Leuresthes tenuis]|uniref:TSC22 domain family protein 1 isoform X1 n=1 Tax=Leuresthes tenuis TaxID=355514 RepID=UPI003B513D1F